MNTSKRSVRLLAEICRQKGIRKIVFSPGSRSAPLVIAFTQIPEIECLVIPDERVAGYFALGVAQQTQRTVAVVCTSGTAVINLGPALCEAFYQHIPLLFLTADRPVGAEERGENQAINQALIFQKMTNASYDLDGDGTSQAAMKSFAEQVELAIDATHTIVPGPVHLNLRLSEPLYALTGDDELNYILTATQNNKVKATSQAIDDLQKQLAHVGKRMIVVGMRNADKRLIEKLRHLSRREDTVVLFETGSNTAAVEAGIWNYDGCIDSINKEQLADYLPEIVITLGSQIISKKLRQLLKANPPMYHWDISPYGDHRKHDIFDIKTNQYPISESELLEVLLASVQQPSSFCSQWNLLKQREKIRTNAYLEQIGFSDFQVYQILTNAYPEGAHIQYGNSTPIRYSNFFLHLPSVQVNCNRGTSGIDGSVSTAAGAAYQVPQLTICVVGDVSFLYDSNALWNNYLSPNLRIVVINNSGGNIFRLLDGPAKVKNFETFFETQHNLNARHLAEMHGLPYYFCENQPDLENILPSFFNSHLGKAAILEIKTNGIVSAEIHKQYFNYLKSAE